MRILKKARFVVCLIFEPSLETEGVLTLLFGPPPSPVSILESWGFTPAASSSLIYKKSMKVTEMKTRGTKLPKIKMKKKIRSLLLQIQEPTSNFWTYSLLKSLYLLVQFLNLFFRFCITLLLSILQFFHSLCTHFLVRLLFKQTQEITISRYTI